MARFLVDEDLPRSLAAGGRAKGVDAVHALDAGLLAKPNREILITAVGQQRSVVTADREFGNPLLYPPGSHAGVVLVRVPEWLDPDMRINRVVDALVSLAGDVLHGTIAVVDMARIRMRRFRR